MHAAYQIKGSYKTNAMVPFIFVSNNCIYNIENMKIKLFKIAKLSIKRIDTKPMHACSISS